QGLLRQFRVAVVCTTDDPADSLEQHAALARRKDPDTRVVPTWRPDPALAIESPESFNGWMTRLEVAADASISTLADFLDALDRRHAAFHEAGCRASDHGLEQIYAEPWTDSEVAATFNRARSGKPPDAGAAVRYKSALLHRFALMD